jgi:hypothetical protein
MWALIPGITVHKKDVLGADVGGGITNSKPLGPIIMMSQSEILSSSQVIFITLL